MTQKTYSHLAKHRRMPTEYEIATSALLYYPKLGFEVETPLAAWYARYQRGDDAESLRLEDWDRFADPEATTYARYVKRAAEREAFVDGVWRCAAASGQDEALSPGWIHELERILPVLRFPLHGLQMASAYVGQMTPGGRVVCAAAFQAADEMRRITGIAKRMHVLKAVKPDFGASSRERWEKAPEWQPLRELIERLLVAYDLTEAFAALCLAVKPRFDELFFGTWGKRAVDAGDDALAKACFSWQEDGAWHLAWSDALKAVLVAERPRNAELLARHAEVWAKRTDDALAPLRDLFLN